MKVLVATKETQGQRKNDFCHVPEGELVTFGSECDNEPVDGKCGCKRALVGMKCHKATTTFKVVDKRMTPEEYREALIASMKDAGWWDLMNGKEQKILKQDMAGLLNLTEHFQEGDILEKRGNDYNVRNLEEKK